MAYDNTLREEEIKNKLRVDYFKEYDSTQQLGNIDFAVAVPVDGPQLFETEYLLWAESKRGTQADIYESFVQLILTIGKARTFDKHLPPAFLGAFDSEKIAFIPYNEVLDIFYQNDFNWNVTPSDHTTKEFLQVLAKVKGILEKDMMLYYFANDDKELRYFIRCNFIVGKSEVSKIRINKNNFVNIYLKWLTTVKPTIAIEWDIAKKDGIIDADFYLADILSERNISLREKLFVVLHNDRYYYNKQRKATGAQSFDVVDFNDGQAAHTQFWNRYQRPPRREYWDYIVLRHDLLVPQDVRERKGSYFTPQCWVELSQQYLAEELGENWQDDYYIWDCAAGTGNLLAGLTNKYNIWASTLDQADVDVMHDRIDNGANLLDSHVFQFDFLNNSFHDEEDTDGKMVYTKLPKSLQDVIYDPEKRKKLVIYINPPYAEASNARTITGTGQNREGLSVSVVKAKYGDKMGRAVNEVYAQFFAKIVTELKGCTLAMFSTLKTLQAPNFVGFRKSFNSKLLRAFVVPANTFDNVKGQFPIGFQIWETEIEPTEYFREIVADVYDAKANFIGKKTLSAYDGELFIISWLRQYYDKAGEHYAYLRYLGTDFQNNDGVFLTLCPSSNDLKQVKGTWVTPHNITPMCIYFSVRHCIEQTWLNNSDQFLYPNDGWERDTEFQSDCLVFALLNGKNRISCQHGVNHFIPFTEQEVGAQERFDSHFIHDFMCGKIKPRSSEEQEAYEKDDKNYVSGDAFAKPDSKIATFYNGKSPMEFSDTAQAVLDAGRELWRYYHSQEKALTDASFYDIRLHFQGVNDKGKMNTKSDDEHYTELVTELRHRLKILAKKIEPKVYEYGFLRE